MPRKRYSSEQISVHLRDAELELVEGQGTLLGIRVHFCRERIADFFWQQFNRPWTRTHSWST